MLNSTCISRSNFARYTQILQQFQKHSVLVQGGLCDLQTLLRQIHAVVFVHNNVADIHQPLEVNSNRRPLNIQFVGKIRAMDFPFPG